MRGILLFGGLATLVFWAWSDWAETELPDSNVDTGLDRVAAVIDEIIMEEGENVATMKVSDSLISMLKKRETLSLKRYVDRTGWSWGYGHFSRDINHLPEVITKAKAEELFLDDIEERSQKWVRLYTKVPLKQTEFDALASLAYNMSPRSFKKFADSVNAGNGIRAIAEKSVFWVEAHLQGGIRARRMAECALFEKGVYG